MSPVLFLHGVTSSRRVWWRFVADLSDLGHPTLALDLAGHGDHHPEPPRASITALADDVAERVTTAEPGAAVRRLVVGHSLGAIVALSLAARRPDLVAAVVVVDPPGIGRGGVVPTKVAEGVRSDVRAAREDPDGLAADIRAAHPTWSPADVSAMVESRSLVDVDHVSALLGDRPWDLPALLQACPVPVHLVAATTPETALRGEDRATLTATLPPDRVTVVTSGHSVQLDRPALLLGLLLRVLEQTPLSEGSCHWTRETSPAE